MTERLLLEDILPLDELQRHGKVLLIRHKHDRLNEMIDNDEMIEEYQSHQNASKFRDCSIIISFIATERKLCYLYGVFQINSILEPESRPNCSDLLTELAPPSANDFYLQTTRLQEYDKYKNRLVIDWMISQPWCHGIENTRSKEVVRLMPYNYVQDFPGLENIVLGYPDLKSIVENPDSHIEWYNTLRNLQAVYLIVYKHKDTYQHYVGTTWGKDGLWHRWSSYAKGDWTVDNVGIIELKKQDPNFTEHLQFSILESMPKSTKQEAATETETLWKIKLGSKEIGLNRN
jgi:hypothetical protein